MCTHVNMVLSFFKSVCSFVRLFNMCVKNMFRQQNKITMNSKIHKNMPQPLKLAFITGRTLLESLNNLQASKMPEHWLHNSYESNPFSSLIYNIQYIHHSQLCFQYWVCAQQRNPTIHHYRSNKIETQQQTRKQENLTPPY